MNLDNSLQPGAVRGVTSPKSTRGTKRSDSLYWTAILLFCLVVFGLTGFGVGILAEAGTSTGTDAAKLLRFHDRQLYWWLPAGLLLGAGAAFVPLDLQRRRGWCDWGALLRLGVWLYYGITCLVLAAILLPKVGTSVLGSVRWLTIPPGAKEGITLQISDFAKVSFVLAFALVLSDASRHLQPGGENWRNMAGGAHGGGKASKFWPPLRRVRGWPYYRSATPAWHGFFSSFVCPCIVLAVPVALIAAETDVGTLAIFAGVGGILLFANGARLRYLIPSFVLALVVFCVGVAMNPPRLRRIIGFIDPEGLSDDISRQLYQGMMGLASGGVEGVGIGNTLQQRGYVTQAQTDFVFAVVGEGTGIIGTSLVAAGYLLIFLIVLLCLRRAHNPFQFNVCLGAMLFLVIQALVNMCVVTGLFPTTGVALPFVSYGGSSLVNSFILAGLILNCLVRWRNPPKEETLPAEDIGLPDAVEFPPFPAAAGTDSGPDAAPQAQPWDSNPEARP